MTVIDVHERKRFNERRFVTQLLHDSPQVRVVVFGLEPGQVVEPHSAPSTVIAYVVEGEGTFSGADESVDLGAGSLVVYDPGEPHGIAAKEERLTFLAVVAPRPG